MYLDSECDSKENIFSVKLHSLHTGTVSVTEGRIVFVLLYYMCTDIDDILTFSVLCSVLFHVNK